MFDKVNMTITRRRRRPRAEQKRPAGRSKRAAPGSAGRPTAPRKGRPGQWSQWRRPPVRRWPRGRSLEIARPIKRVPFCLCCRPSDRRPRVPSRMDVLCAFLASSIWQALCPRLVVCLSCLVRQLSPMSCACDPAILPAIMSTERERGPLSLPRAGQVLC